MTRSAGPVALGETEMRNVGSYPEIPGTYPTPKRAFPAQRYFEDVDEGDRIDAEA